MPALSSNSLHPRTGIDVDVSATLGIRFRPIDAFLCSMIPLEQLPDRYPDSTPRLYTLDLRGGDSEEEKGDEVLFDLVICARKSNRCEAKFLR